MRATGDVRPLDQLGRVVIPIQLRKKFGILIGTPLEIAINNDLIHLKKYKPKCVFCGAEDNISTKMGKNICDSCMEDIKKL